jgi:hypothetical protein
MAVGLLLFASILGKGAHPHLVPLDDARLLPLNVTQRDLPTSGGVTNNSQNRSDSLEKDMDQPTSMAKLGPEAALPPRGSVLSSRRRVVEYSYNPTWQLFSQHVGGGERLSASTRALVVTAFCICTLLCCIVCCWFMRDDDGELDGCGGERKGS